MWEPGALVLEGRFRILSALGLGSATEAYVAEQVSLSRRVTLKVIRADLGVSKDLGERFDREMKRLAAVDHAGVVRVIDSGRSEGSMYFVTELVEGAPLSAELHGEPLLPERAVAIIVQLAEALTAVHERNLVHGELRPDSVVVQGAKAKLDGFGIARLVDATDPGERVTFVARAIGPLEYLAPEQLRGATGDPSSDVWALGVIAYQLLSGVLPDPKAPRALVEVAGHLADHAKLCSVVMQCLSAQRPTPRELAKKLASLPAPAEPTLFLESMQRPPELPAKPAPPPLPEPVEKPVPQLMPSVAMPIGTPTMSGIDPVLEQVARHGPSPVNPKVKRAKGVYVAGLAVLAAAVAVGAWILSGSTARDARRLIEMRQPSQALEVLNHALRKSPDADLLALKAAALHLSQSHAEELAVFRSVPPGSRAALDPLVLSGLVEDFGRSEDKALDAALHSLAPEPLQKALMSFAREPVSARQWGALRYLDVAHAAAGLNLAELYAISLESSACPVRRTAAKRLGQLDDDSAEAALLRLRELPREGADFGCGQDEAAAALQTLKRAH